MNPLTISLRLLAVSAGTHYGPSPYGRFPLGPPFA